MAKNNGKATPFKRVVALYGPNHCPLIIVAAWLTIKASSAPKITLASTGKSLTNTYLKIVIVKH